MPIAVLIAYTEQGYGSFDPYPYFYPAMPVLCVFRILPYYTHSAKSFGGFSLSKRADVKIAASEPVARRKRATHAGEVSHAISRKKLHGKI